MLNLLTFQYVKHTSVLMKLLSEELNVGLDDILDFELCLADAVPSVSAVVNSNLCNYCFRKDQRQTCAVKCKKFIGVEGYCLCFKFSL